MDDQRHEPPGESRIVAELKIGRPRRSGALLAVAVNPRYTRKAIYLFEPDQYFLWKDYNLDSLCQYLRERCAAWLDD